jgi:hypothetical protein
VIIGLSGLIGSGKGTVAKILVNDFGYHEVAYADTLKDVLAVIFSWDRAMLEGDTEMSRAWRELPDTWWEKRLKWPGFCPRVAMQQVGTNLFRSHFNPDIWVHALTKKIADLGAQQVVVSDCRFFNELDAIRDLGGYLVRVKRGPDPDWFQHAISANTHFNQSIREAASNFLDEKGVHPSESSWAGYSFDDVIENSADIEQLATFTDQLVSRLASKSAQA